MSTPEQFLEGDLPEKKDESLTSDGVEREAQNIIDGLRGVINPKKNR